MALSNARRPHIPSRVPRSRAGRAKAVWRNGSFVDAVQPDAPQHDVAAIDALDDDGVADACAVGARPLSGERLGPRLTGPESLPRPLLDDPAASQESIRFVWPRRGGRCR